MTQKRYFVNLNGVRFIASFLVLIHHIEQAKYAFDLPSLYKWSVMQHAGRLGVGLFFTLSGFLITYLLIQEKTNYGDIEAKKFYLRRVFRIWPIYFVLVISSYFIFPHVPLLSYMDTDRLLERHYWERMLFLGMVLPNFAFVLYDLPYWCAQTWSIGVEEQFYYLWPWLWKYPKRRILIVSIFLLVSAAFLGIGLCALSEPEDVLLVKFWTFIGQFRIHVMALGGFMAWLVFKEKQNVLSLLFRKDLQIVVYALLLGLFFSGIHFRGFMEVYGLFFAFFVVNVSCNPQSVINLEFKWISYLGKISYGLYLYHVVLVVLAINCLNRFLPELDTIEYNILLYCLSIGLSVAVSALSFEYFEKPLLRFKDRHYGR